MSKILPINIQNLKQVFLFRLCLYTADCIRQYKLAKRAEFFWSILRSRDVPLSRYGSEGSIFEWRVGWFKKFFTGKEYPLFPFYW